MWSWRSANAGAKSTVQEKDSDIWTSQAGLDFDLWCCLEFERCLTLEKVSPCIFLWEKTVSDEFSLV